ncbi:MAG: hypothetical protein MZV70_05960 [Desulfobacterales bacterium]|nr:hypothetical protein [Desulfobacterales bacterium]
MAADELFCRHIHLCLQHGFGPHPRRDEPTVHRRFLPGLWWIGSGGVSRTSPSPRTSSSASPGRPRRTSRRPWTSCGEVGYSYSFMYHFNPRRELRPPAWRTAVPDRVKKARLARVIALQKELTRSRMEERLGTVTEVLVESVSRRRKTELLGRTSGGHDGRVPGTRRKGGQFRPGSARIDTGEYVPSQGGTVMPFRLFFLALVMVLLVTFIGFNIENRCDVSFAFYKFEDVPVVLTILSSFALGLVAGLPFALRRRSPGLGFQAPRAKKGKPGAAVGEPPRDERFPDGGAGTP